MNEEPHCSTVAELHDAIGTMTTPTTRIYGGVYKEAEKPYYLSFLTGPTGACVTLPADLYHLFFDSAGCYWEGNNSKSMYRKDAALLVLRKLLRNQKLASLGIN